MVFVYKWHLLVQGVRPGDKLVNLLLSIRGLTVDSCRELSLVLYEVWIGSRFEVASNSATSQFVKGLNLELLAVDKEFLQAIYVMLNVEKLDKSHIFLKFVVSGREHQSWHHFQVVEFFTILDDDIQVMRVDRELQARACGVSLELLMNVAAHETDLSWHSERLGRRLAHRWHAVVVRSRCTVHIGFSRCGSDGGDQSQLFL